MHAIRLLMVAAQAGSQVEHLLVRGGRSGILLAGRVSGQSALDAIRRLRPDVLVLAALPWFAWMTELLQTLARRGLPVRVVVVADPVQVDQVAKLVQLGACGIVPLAHAPEELIPAIREVASGGVWLEHGAIGSTLRAGRRESETPSRELTARELEVARLACEGLQNKEIAARLRVGERTVRMHLHNVYAKLDIEGRLDLALAVGRLGLLSS